MITHRANDDTLRQMTLGLLVVVENIVYHEIKAGAQVGHIAAERLVRVDRYLQTIDVYAEVGFKELLDIRIFIALHLLAGETSRHEVIEGLIAHSVHRLWSM